MEPQMEGKWNPNKIQYFYFFLIFCVFYNVIILYNQIVIIGNGRGWNNGTQLVILLVFIDFYFFYFFFYTPFHPSTYSIS
jgi:hypothetical protein